MGFKVDDETVSCLKEHNLYDHDFLSEVEDEFKWLKRLVFSFGTLKRKYYMFVLSFVVYSNLNLIHRFRNENRT